jgi:predicted dehydrogenase
MTSRARRGFLKSTLASAATVALSGTKSSGRIIGANDTVRVAVAGINGRGSSHIDEFAGMKNVEIVTLVDPDRRTYKSRLAQLVKKGRPEAKTEVDIRRVLDDKSVNAVSVATPNHWHSLITIWACQAEKDVYVEKPCSHNIHEGRIAVEAARKYKRIVQHGTQSRSSQGWEDLAALAQSGKLGKLLISRALCYKDGGTGFTTRGDIGARKPKDPPADLNFDIWLGPAAEQPYHDNLVHYRWHWFWDFGNGDIGNQGVHEMDKARWLIPGATWPKSVISIGGRFANDDQGQTPNAMVTAMDFGETQLIFEVRGLKSAKYYGQQVGNILHFEEGIVAGDKFYPKGKSEGQPIPKVSSKVRISGGHFQNFISCVRSRNTADLHAEIGVGHISSGLCHLANMSYRLGQATEFDARHLKVAGNEACTEALGRMSEHLREDAVKFAGKQLHVGAVIEYDPEAHVVKNNSAANALLTRKYRAPFIVPEKL